ELWRAREMKRSDFGTMQNVDQRTADLQAAQASIDDAKAQIRDAQFDLEHCRITAPFTGRVGTHLVSMGNLIAGSRYATSPTTLLATLVSLDPIYFDFDMSEADFLTFSRDRARLKGSLADKVELAIGDIRGDWRVIRSGLTPNDQVIIDGIPYARPGSKVAPQEGAIRYAAAQAHD